MPSIATFNANNFFLRYKFQRNLPNSWSKDSLIEASEVGTIGYMPGLAFRKYTKNFIVWDAARRKVAVKALKEPDNRFPDILCFQEVENIHAIRLFNQKYLDNHYPYSLLIDSYDPRNIDVGILSRYPIKAIHSHIDAAKNGKPIFSRDCLEAEIEIPGENLYLFVNHLKSKLVIRRKNESDESYNNRMRESHGKREAQAKEVLKLVKKRFHGAHDTALYAVIGDFNDTPYSPYLKSLMNSLYLTDVLNKFRPQNDAWTYYWRARNRVSQIDYVLASKALTARILNKVNSDNKFTPHIERQGLAFREKNSQGLILPQKATLQYFEQDEVTQPNPAAPQNEKVDFRFQRFPEVDQDWKQNISDHCPVKVWF